ncbi:MAG: BrnT family toxin [Spirochaetales bacterium]|nr:BrnT family toxin [Spirochaetales bacterium]
MKDELHFEWDPTNALINKEKHHISFEEAQTFFWDENALLISDPDHSSEIEDRFILLGLSQNLNLLVVCHCYIKDATIRLISTRKADKKESRQYEVRL